MSAATAGERVAILERAPKSERGGQSRYTEAYLRMKSETEVTDDFEDQFASGDIGRVNQAFQRAVIEQNDYDMEFSIQRPDGETRFIRCEGRCSCPRRCRCWRWRCPA